MIKIIKHGHAQYKMKCEYCECIFTFEDSDIHVSGDQRDWCEWIDCPECHRSLTIISREKYKNHSFD